jgi:di/tricarboxylate transporter
MWITNTATTAMMAPITSAILQALEAVRITSTILKAYINIEIEYLHVLETHHATISMYEILK